MQVHYGILFLWACLFVIAPLLVPLPLAISLSMARLRVTPLWILGMFICFLGFCVGIIMMFIPAIQIGNAAGQSVSAVWLPGLDIDVICASFFGGLGCLIAACVPRRAPEPQEPPKMVRMKVAEPIPENRWISEKRSIRKPR